MSKQTDAIGAGTGISVPLRERMAGWRERAERGICLLDARMRTLTAEPEEGAATAEYAVVLVAATGFAALLVAILNPNGEEPADGYRQAGAERGMSQRMNQRRDIRRIHFGTVGERRRNRRLWRGWRLAADEGAVHRGIRGCSPPSSWLPWY